MFLLLFIFLSKMKRVIFVFFYVMIYWYTDIAIWLINSSCCFFWIADFHSHNMGVSVSKWGSRSPKISPPNHETFQPYYSAKEFPGTPRNGTPLWERGTIFGGTWKFPWCSGIETIRSNTRNLKTSSSSHSTCQVAPGTKRKRESLPTIYFQGLLLLVSGRVTHAEFSETDFSLRSPKRIHFVDPNLS